METDKAKQVEINRCFGALKAKITNISKFISDYNPQNNTLQEVEQRLNALNKVPERLEVLISDYAKALSDVDFNEMYASFDSLENNYYDASAKLNEISTNIKAEQLETASDIDHINKNPLIDNNNKSIIRLPHIDIPQFDGNLLEWLTFKDTFVALVHNNKGLSDIAKFTYLLGKLKGDAKNTIGHITLSDAGYQKAWKDLNSRYDNERIIVFKHIEGICNLPCLSRDNSSDLRNLLNLSNSHVSSIIACGKELDELSELFIVYLISQKLDIQNRKEWEELVSREDKADWSLLYEFLQQKCKVSESIDSKKKNPNSSASHSHAKSHNKQNISSSFATSTKSKCRLCKEHFHYLYACSAFKKLSQLERFNKAKELQVCINCFSPSHSVMDCTSRYSCKICHKKHNSMLHRYDQTESIPSSQNDLETALPNTNSSSLPANANTFQCSNSQAVETKIILATALVKIQDHQGQYQECRALLDSGSESNFISSHLALKLKFKNMTISSISISGINDISTQVSSKLSTKIKSKFSKFDRLLNFLVIPTITNSLPHNNFDISKWNIPQNIKLSDFCFNLSRPIDLLLGAEIYFEILKPKQIIMSPNLPILQESLLGWLVSGKYETPSVAHNFSIQTQPMEDIKYEKSNEPCLEILLKQFWELESFPVKTFLSPDETFCENHYVQTHTRDANGRYTVSLPLNSKINLLGDSKTQAIKRFKHLENKLNLNPNLKDQYTKFIQEYMDLNHMKKIDPTSSKSGNPFYLPHHAVLRPDKTTTKLRVVFDGSAQTSSNISLNDTLLVGPTIQQPLFNIILRFRKFNYVLTSDIIKMYRQININPDQTHLQRILWRYDFNQPIDEYELLTVTYGTSSASWLAIRTIKQLALDEESSHPLASKIILRDFYVDDILTGGDTIDEVVQIQRELDIVLNKGCFSLHKWCTNNSQILKEVPPSRREILQSNGTSDSNTIKTLGLSWKPEEDAFNFNINPCEIRKTITKRGVVAEVAKLFDPLGLISPIIITAKIFIQSLWLDHLGWDDQLNDIQIQNWFQILNSLGEINSIQLPRQVLANNYTAIELHGFADASERAYCACVYIRSILKDKSISINLLCSKTRVAPMKFTTLPRLELSAALLLSQLVNIVIKAMELKFDKIILWTDSMITLCWVKTSPHKLKTFIANRVNEIQELTSHFTWNHVSSQNNSADIGSRGIILENPSQLETWFKGPRFLHDNDFLEPTQAEVTNFDSKTLELKPQVVSALVSTDHKNFSIWSKFSSLKTLQHVTAFCLRFINNCKNKIKPLTKNTDPKLVSSLTVEELNQSLLKLVVLAQNESFQTEISCLKRNVEIPKNSRLNQLNVFLDQNLYLRVGGRLRNTNYDYDVKHQLLLPAKHPLTNLLLLDHHIRHLHPGPQLLVSLIRQRFWPLNAKNSAKYIVKNCVTCFKTKPIISQQIMGDLQAERATSSRPFNTTGVDLCGPFLIHEKYQRRKQPSKVYVASFICFATKGIHLEIVSDLSSVAFIACLKRFIYRRGKPDTIWSDNATNFVGTSRELQKQFQIYLDQPEVDKIVKFCSDEQISWRFIPPRSPNFGGLWEASIKSFKTHLKKVASNAQFSYEEFNTLIIHIEGILNSRPLTLLSEDPSDPLPLTPAHFLTGGPIISLVEPSLSELPSNRLSKWETIYNMSEHFWKRFSIEYIHTLQERSKWRSVSPNLAIGDVVLIADDSTHATHWLLGKIEEVISGSDGRVRVALIKTKSGIIKRAISKISKLPIYK